MNDLRFGVVIGPSANAFSVPGGRIPIGLQARAVANGVDDLDDLLEEEGPYGV